EVWLKASHLHSWSTHRPHCNLWNLLQFHFPEGLRRCLTSPPGPYSSHYSMSGLPGYFPLRFPLTVLLMLQGEWLFFSEMIYSSFSFSFTLLLCSCSTCNFICPVCSRIPCGIVNNRCALIYYNDVHFLAFLE